MDSRFGSLPGVIRTRVGYTGGSTPDPTYHDLGDHTESVQVDFDPARVSYARLLEVFLEAHDPCSVPWSTQYRNIVFYHGPDQERQVQQAMAREAARRQGEVHTQVRPAGRFYRAEDYHQKYYLRQETRLYAEFSRMFPDPVDFTDSTAAARVNGFLGGNGTRADLEPILESLGLSPEGSRFLLDQAAGRR